MNSRERILSKLRSASRPFPEVKESAEQLHVVPLEAADQGGLTERFIREAVKLACQVHPAAGEAQATAELIDLIRAAGRISCWDSAHIPLPGLAAAIQAAGNQVTGPEDPQAQFGITGADAALAATGSLVLHSGPGRPRAVSLLPPVHIAILREDQILPDLETWLEGRRGAVADAVQRPSNTVIISGPSRTADISMELVMGMHGPREVHIILLTYSKIKPARLV